MTIDSNTSLNELLNHAVGALKELNNDDGEFVLKDLFRGFEWNRITKGDRTKLGSMFLSYSRNENTAIIEPTEKTPQNQQKYKTRGK
ncbi:DUF1413 domain-containing protein [Lentibacillus sp. Marseille-P4043]|uniref:DUF1413 domain-containing protein n=1 Tax=Lentibacillus sp. Marseille-P4043 TaxID=2040293 RepID=UPI0018F8AD01|nr:DUF1413 domain-containing protein [Lentibacillus sp. Marseille-P4043]